MSEIIVPFLYELRARRLGVGAQEAVQLARALSFGLHANTLDGFYYVARALMVHRESELDKFDEAFLSHFKGVVFETTNFLAELEEWLEDPKILQGLTEEQKAALQELSPEELRELL